MPRQNVQRFNEPVIAPDFLRLDGRDIGDFDTIPTIGAAAMGSSSLAAGNTDVLTSSGSVTNTLTEFTYDANGVDDGPTRLIPADINEFFHLNIQHVISADSDITLSGFAEIIYLDMGGPAAS